MFKFITSRPLWVNIAAAAALTFLLVFIFLRMLGWITRHGDHLTVPDVMGKKTDKAIALLEMQGFDVQIQDSIYTDTAAAGVVLKQLPDPNATVKVNRTVFLTVNRLVPPMIDMPKLEGQTLRFALDMLTRSHLQLADTIYRPNFMMGSILEQQLNGVRIPEKTKVQWGSRITLIVGGGLGNQQMLVPELVGLTYAEAKAVLEGNGIDIGAVIATGVVRDTASAYVYRQNPERFDEESKPIYIQAGQVMDLYISAVMIDPADTLSTKKKNQQP
ncbi:MAG: PASTA domain-containing protein [Chitinophagaceae bacterium]|nr:PASTA domain-containing protein [Chitinophagaceae bacterium]